MKARWVRCRSCHAQAARLVLTQDLHHIRDDAARVRADLVPAEAVEIGLHLVDEPLRLLPCRERVRIG